MTNVRPIACQIDDDDKYCDNHINNDVDYVDDVNRQAWGRQQ